MITYPNIDPVAFQIGPIQVQWYGLMYLVGFACAWLLGCYRAKRSNGVWTYTQVSDLVFYGALGAVIGGRIGYILFYDFEGFLHDPLVLFRIWEGGMSFHGGFLGAMFALWLYGRKINKPFFAMMDFVAPLVPLGLGAGRIGNFINGELWGRVSNVPWAMVFPNAGPLPRHPSQLYEFLLEGVLLFIIVWWYSSKPRPRMAVSAVFVIGYGCFRTFVEFFRQPDIQIGFVAFNWLTMGQLLSVPLVIGGLILLWLAYHRNNFSS